jgi:DNA-binding Lrp family transcriptional regulator
LRNAVFGGSLNKSCRGGSADPKPDRLLFMPRLWRKGMVIIMVTAVIQVKITPQAKYGYKSIAKIIAEFKEVESVYLVSGDYDLSVIVNCGDLREIGKFVGEKLSTIEGVIHTTSAFIMDRYKQSGEILEVDDDERGLFTI